MRICRNHRLDRRCRDGSIALKYAPQTPAATRIVDPKRPNSIVDYKGKMLFDFICRDL
jgi:hypothetical protein